MGFEPTTAFGKIAVAFGGGGDGGDGIARATGAACRIAEDRCWRVPNQPVWGCAAGPPMLRRRFRRAEEGLAMLCPLSENGAALSAEFCTVANTDP